jgi:hypothetical protein
MVESSRRRHSSTFSRAKDAAQILSAPCCSQVVCGLLVVLLITTARLIFRGEQSLVTYFSQRKDPSIRAIMMHFNIRIGAPNSKNKQARVLDDFQPATSIPAAELKRVADPTIHTCSSEHLQK